MDGTTVEPGNSPRMGAGLPIVGVGIERDGFRNRRLAITVSMADGVESWGGIYLGNVRRNPAFGADDLQDVRKKTTNGLRR